MKRIKKAKTVIGDTNDYVKANRKASREIELEQNGGRWVAKNRPHKNLKKYNRKRDKSINFDYPFFFAFNAIFIIYKKKYYEKEIN